MIISCQTLANGLALMVGAFLVILAIFRFGFIDNILSKAVLRGFVTAVALIIMVEQLSGLLAIPIPKSKNYPHLTGVMPSDLFMHPQRSS